MIDTETRKLAGKFTKRLEQEPENISRARQNGRKTVGYFCSYVPEEIILAGGMLPLRLAYNSTPVSQPPDDSSAPGCRLCCLPAHPGSNPYYQNLDAICVSSICPESNKHIEYCRDIFKVPVFEVGLPETHSRYRLNPANAAYFASQLKKLRHELSRFSGASIGQLELLRAIGISNKIRQRLRRLYEYPMQEQPPVTWTDVLKITQAGYLLNRRDFLTELDNLQQEIDNVSETNLVIDPRPRLMITGSGIGIGEYELLDLVDEAGGNIVSDFMCTGSMLLRKRVPVFGPVEHPFETLVERYLYNAPCPVMNDLSNRLDRMLVFARHFRVHGLIYVVLDGRDGWKKDYEQTEEVFYRELAVPTFLIETGPGLENGPDIKTRLKSFLDIIGGQV